MREFLCNVMMENIQLLTYNRVNDMGLPSEF